MTQHVSDKYILTTCDTTAAHLTPNETHLGEEEGEQSPQHLLDALAERVGLGALVVEPGRDVSLAGGDLVVGGVHNSCDRDHVFGVGHQRPGLTEA